MHGIEKCRRLTLCHLCSSFGSLHPNGHSLLSAGLDCHVKLWDLRMMETGNVKSGSSSNNNSKRKRSASETSSIAWYNGGKSVNSAFFSPSGQYVVSTTMANKLDIFENLHTATTNVAKPCKNIVHDNMTGRWLTTFMAKWHPSLDLFVVGSMQRPRAIEVFAPTHRQCAISGEQLTAVASRCCFHPSTDQLIIVGGNSSGRVTVIR